MELEDAGREKQRLAAERPEESRSPCPCGGTLSSRLRNFLPMSHFTFSARTEVHSGFHLKVQRPVNPHWPLRLLSPLSSHAVLTLILRPVALWAEDEA